MSSLSLIGVGMFFILCMVSSSKANTELDETPFQNDQEILKEVQGLLQQVQSLLDPYLNASESQDVNAACRCGGFKCTCCQRIRIRKLRINKECCISVAYNGGRSAFVLVFKIGNRVIFRKEISARRPIPICMSVSYLCPGASICIELSGVTIRGRKVHGCLALTGRLFRMRIVKIRLGCFNVGALDANEPGNNMEQPLWYDSNLPEFQQDVPFQPFPTEDNEITMEDIEQPLQDEDQY